MRNARDSRIKGRITNHQLTRVYTLFAIRSFPVHKFSRNFQKSANAIFSFGNARSYCLEERLRTSQCAQRSKSTSIHYTQLLIFDVFTHNSHTSHIVYGRLHTYRCWCKMMPSARVCVEYEYTQIIVLLVNKYFVLVIIRFYTYTCSTLLHT